MYIVGSIFLTIHFKHLDFIEWFDFEFWFDCLVDFLMCLCNLFISLEMFKLSPSGLILRNTQLTFSSAFCLSISLLGFLSVCPNSSTSVASLCL